MRAAPRGDGAARLDIGTDGELEADYAQGPRRHCLDLREDLRVADESDDELVGIGTDLAGLGGVGPVVGHGGGHYHGVV